MILSVCLNPALQRTLWFEQLSINEVNRARRLTLSAGGKGVNVARVLGQLGAETRLLCFLGGEIGELVKKLLRQEKIKTEFVPTRSATRICYTIIDSSHKTQTELVEEAQEVSLDEVTAIRSLYRKLLSHCQMVTISGTAPPGAPEDSYQDFVQLAGDQGIPAIVDAPGKWMLLSLKAHPFIVKGNVKELEAALEKPLNDHQELSRAMNWLHQRGARSVLATKGADGAYLWHEGDFYRLIPPELQVINPIGSGDAMTAGLAAGLCQNQPLLEAAKLGVACGAANVLTPIAGSVRLEDVRKILRQVKIKKIFE
ncbi:MAG: 1-phosphofructokinase family hexose kinase [candidate division KSB1 bacterium]|nr:1-phosphofructokinase family hexose kinase [candidate division KSB1 bacterium]